MTCLMKSFEILYCLMPLCETNTEILEALHDAAFVLTTVHLFCYKM